MDLNRRIGRFTYKQIVDYGEQTIANLNRSELGTFTKLSYNVNSRVDEVKPDGQKV